MSFHPRVVHSVDAQGYRAPKRATELHQLRPTSLPKLLWDKLIRDQSSDCFMMYLSLHQLSNAKESYVKKKDVKLDQDLIIMIKINQFIVKNIFYLNNQII
jgi:hypothetical protein